MIFHFAGKFSGNAEELPNQRLIADAVPFREPAPEKLGLIANGVSLIILVLTFGIGYLRTGGFGFISIPGLIIAVVSLIPHELLHALCFKEDVYMYTFFQKGMLFVVGSEDMSKGRFIFMSLLPNIVFGFIPFIVFLINPAYTLLGSLGALAIAEGAGDYINVYNAATQMPKNSYAYMYRMSTHWHK